VPDILPDSRLINPKDTVMADVEFGDITIRMELEPIYCVSCAKPNGYVPKDVISFVTWICVPCALKYGGDAEKMQSGDEAFWALVEEEMIARFGRVLTQAELEIAADRGILGSSLEKLELESPYRKILKP
jgi:hypothetical protein